MPAQRLGIWDKNTPSDALGELWAEYACSEAWYLGPEIQSDPDTGNVAEYACSEAWYLGQTCPLAVTICRSPAEYACSEAWYLGHAAEHDHVAAVIAEYACSEAWYLGLSRSAWVIAPILWPNMPAQRLGIWDISGSFARHVKIWAEYACSEAWYLGHWSKRARCQRRADERKKNAEQRLPLRTSDLPPTLGVVVRRNGL